MKYLYALLGVISFESCSVRQNLLNPSQTSYVVGNFRNTAEYYDLLIRALHNFLLRFDPSCIDFATALAVAERQKTEAS